MIAERPLSEFAHRGLPEARDPASRLLALAATVLFYAALLLLAWRGFVWVVPPHEIPSPVAAIVRILPSAPQPRMTMQDFTIRLIKPRVANAPLPQIDIRPDPAPKAPLPVTAALASPLAGGATGSAAGAVSGVGTGRGVSACMDPAYLEQIRRHVAHWYMRPMEAESVNGIAYVHFVIDKSGHYKELTLAGSSGNIWLDGAAMRTMRLAEPLPPIPDRFHTDLLNGLMPIVYRFGNAPLKVQHLGGDAKGC